MCDAGLSSVMNRPKLGGSGKLQIEQDIAAESAAVVRRISHQNTTVAATREFCHNPASPQGVSCKLEGAMGSFGELHPRDVPVNVAMDSVGLWLRLL